MSKAKRRAARLVELDDVIRIAFHDDTEDDALIGPTLRGHLALEALMVEFLEFHQPNPTKDYWGWSFPDKADGLLQASLIENYHAEAFKAFNNFRNDLAHIFAKDVQAIDVHGFAGQLERLGIDFSDSLGKQRLSYAKEAYGGVRGILKEIIWCLLFELMQCMADKGARNLNAA